MKDKIKNALKKTGVILKNAPRMIGAKLKSATKNTCMFLWVVIDFEDVVYFAGLGFLTFGVYQINGPAAWIACGTVLIPTSFFRAYQKVKSNGVSDGN